MSKLKPWDLSSFRFINSLYLVTKHDMPMRYVDDPDDLKNEYLQELEQSWRAAQPKFTDSFLFETFGDVLDTMNEKISELKWQRKVLIKEIKERSQPYLNRKDIDAFFARLCIQYFLVAQLAKIEESLFRIERLRRKKSRPRRLSKNGLTDEDIEKARNVSIIQVAETHLGKLRKTGRGYVARCPFHEDQTPSFTLYPDSNRFHCFGCNATGDVIAFTQKIFNCDFKTAIYSLIH